MPQSLVKNYVHIVYSTKHRQPFIKKEIQKELYGYLGSTCKELDCSPIAIGGIEDHIHLLCLLSRKIALSELVSKVKSNSSKWIKTNGASYFNFYWQRGYGAFSVNPSQVEVVIRYIRNQEAHHAKQTYKEEYLLFLKKYEIEYDERYVWD